MSGNSGSGPSITGPYPNENCENLVINTHLSSPDPAVLETLEEGDILTIRVQGDQGPIQAVDDAGVVAGNIISREQARLLQCINEGTQYVADVISIRKAHCDIQIHAQ